MHFQAKWEQYQRSKRLYLTQKPIDEVRLKLLREAGFSAKPQIIAPALPRLSVIQSVKGLQSMMVRGMELLAEEESKSSPLDFGSKLMQSILKKP